MVITKEVELPDNKTLTVDEVNLSTATLMSAGPYLGRVCEAINNEFMLCRFEQKDPRRCLALGKKVTECTMKFFQSVKKECLEEFNQYANCVDKSSDNFEPWHCRKTQKVFDLCMYRKLNIVRPDFGYFTRGRIHSSPSPKPKPPPCPCESKVPDPTPSLPDCKERKNSRFNGRFFWTHE